MEHRRQEESKAEAKAETKLDIEFSMELTAKSSEDGELFSEMEYRYRGYNAGLAALVEHERAGTELLMKMFKVGEQALSLKEANGSR